MQETYVGKSISGFEFEVKRLKGYHQDWLTKTKKSSVNRKNAGEKTLIDIMMDVLVRIGDHEFGKDSKEDKKLMDCIPSWDLKYMMVTCRFFSTDRSFVERMAEYEEYLSQCEEVKKYNKENPDEEMEMPKYESSLDPHKFVFQYEYKDSESGDMKEEDYEVEVNMFDFKAKKPEFTLETVEEILEGYKGMVKLPISGTEAHWTPLNVGLEERFKGDKEVTANSPIKWRHPVKKEKTANSTVEIALRLERMELLDIEALRKEIFTKEGKFDTTIVVAHPEDEDKDLKVELVNLITFFFPSAVV